LENLGSFFHSYDEARWHILKVLYDRRGPSKLRTQLLNNYGNACAITGSKIEELLEVSLIVPFSQLGKEELHSVQNALLLASDVHVLFDKYMWIVTEDYKVAICDKLLNSEDERIKQLDGKNLLKPESPEDWPSQEHLEQHRHIALCLHQYSQSIVLEDLSLK